MKMSGADFRAFLNAKDPWWPDGLIVEEEAIRINGGKEGELPTDGQYADSDVIEIVGGALAWENLERSEGQGADTD